MHGRAEPSALPYVPVHPCPPLDPRLAPLSPLPCLTPHPPGTARRGSTKGDATPGLAGAGKDHRPRQLAVSPSMEHLASLSAAASHASMASLAGAAGAAEAEAVPLLAGPAAAARVPVVLPR